MSADCSCCRQPSIGLVNDQFFCHLCLATFCKPADSKASSCPRCLQRQKSVRAVCACGYAGSLQPCCPVCMYSRVEDYEAGTGEEWWTCGNCGLMGLRTQFCVRCAQERSAEVPQSEEPHCKAPVQTADLREAKKPYAEARSRDTWKCEYCEYDQNTESRCQVCGISALSPVLGLVNQLLSPQPPWNCPECNSPNLVDSTECQACQCPKDVAGPPCANCASFNRGGSQQCRRCGVSIFLPLAPIPTCPTCGGALPGNGLQCPCLAQMKPVTKSTWINVRTTVQAEGKRLLKRLFH